MARKKKSETEPKKEETKVKKLSPFDIMNLIFSKNLQDFNSISQKDLDRNYYIINDRFSINYPQHAQFFNHYKINGASVVKCWFNFMFGQNFRGTPKWVYTPGRKKSEDEKKENNQFPKATLKEFAIANDLSIKDVEFALEIDPVETTKEINQYIETQKQLEEMRKMSLNDMKSDNPVEEKVILDMNDDNQTAIF